MRTHYIVLVVAMLASAAAVSHASYQDDIVALVNDLRVSSGISALTVSPELTVAAQAYADYLLTTGQLTHFPSDGSSPTSRAIKAGYRGIGEISELLTAAVSTPQQAFTVWSMSPSHKMGMLTPYFKEIGVGYAYDPKYLRDSKHNYGRVWVIMLGCGPDPSTSAEPVIESISPVAGPIGTRVCIQGRDFGTRSEVWFNGVRARIAYQSNTVLLAYVPSSATTGSVSVRNAISGKVAVGPTFTVASASAPVVSSINPESAPVGDTVVINGSGFGTAAGRVKFVGTVARTRYWSSRTIRVQIPNGAFSGPACVVRSDGQESNPIQFTVETDAPQAPVITRIQPASVRPGQPVNIYGANFGDYGMVKFEGLTAEVIYWDNCLITAVAPDGVGDGCIVVVNADGAESNAVSYTVTTAAITGIAPTAGPPGTEVTIAGSGFGAGGTAAFNGAEAEVTFWSDTVVKAKVPAGATSGEVTIRTDDGQVAHGPEFVVESNPSVTLVFTGSVNSVQRPACHSARIENDGEVDAVLESLGSAKLELRLYVRTNNRWRYMGKSTSESGVERLRQAVRADTYLFQVSSLSGAGDYRLTVRLP